MSYNDILISTANFIPGYKVTELKGFTYGLTVRSRGAGGNISASLKSLVGGEVGAYKKMMEESRDEAMNRLSQHAKELGANGIISVRFDSDSIGQSMQEVIAYGTAVVVEKE
ncbi:MAG: heavy metal-binding domain-containing protein [Methanobrevibacter sp.]|jgi:uncharacterized protein YbjQ (UPF0145 family)|nr:heavy metal-binding domain-containing protein [Methanobrevibacter sp.]